MFPVDLNNPSSDEEEDVQTLKPKLRKRPHYDEFSSNVNPQKKSRVKVKMTVHEGVMCQHCQQLPIYGTRYKV